MSVNHQTGAAEYLWLDDARLIAQCDVDCYRSSGPGGQKRNKTSSAVRLRHEPTGLAATAAEDRSQHVNKVRALRRLRRVIALHIRSSIDLDRYMPSELLHECIGGEGRFRVNRRDVRYYLAISEVLDVLTASDMSVRELAQHLGMSTGQVIKLLRADSRLWARVNEMREEVGVKRLRSSTK